jgi:transposase-like protein
MKEVYTVHEFAKIMGVPWQQVASWKRRGQIPANAITPEGALIKSVIDPLTDAYKKSLSASLSPKTKVPLNKHSKVMPKKKKNYPPKIRKEAIRLMFEENLTTGQVAKQLGCSVECARQWKVKHLQAIPLSRSASAKPSSKQTARTAKAASVDFDEFARQYWQEGTRAVDVLLLHPEVGPDIVRYVNEALRYAFEKLR